MNSSNASAATGTSTSASGCTRMLKLSAGGLSVTVAGAACASDITRVARGAT